MDLHVLEGRDFWLEMSGWVNAWKILLLCFVCGLIASKLTEKPRIPDVVSFLLVGILFGPSVLGWIHVSPNSEVNQFIVNLGAAFILFDGGREIRISIMKQVWLSIALLSTVGILVTAVVVAWIAHMVLHTPWVFSFLLGAVLSSTDPATLIPVFRRVPIVDKLQQMLESESALNDATAAVLVMSVLAVLTLHTSIQIGSMIDQFLILALIGLCAGILFGWLGLWVLSPQGWGIFREYPSFIHLIVVLSAYICAYLLHGSGFMAVFAAGIVIGNGRTFGLKLHAHTEREVHYFYRVITVVFRMLIFILLGTQVDFHLLLKFIWPSLVIVAILIFIARPMTVASSVLIDKKAAWSNRDILFMMWVRETGVIPAALANAVAATHLPGSQIILAVTFVAILMTILIQGTSTGWVAQKLGLRINFVEEET